MNIRSNQYHIRQLYHESGRYDEEFYRNYRDEKSRNFKLNQYPSERKPDYYRVYYEDEPLLSPKKYNGISRYAKVPTMKKLGKTYHATNRYRGVKYSNNDNVYVVTNSTANRLDLISTIYYNDPKYWWIIAHANNIFDVLNDIPRGTKLRIPPLSSIQGHYV